MLETSENYIGTKSSGAVLQVKQKGLIQICGFVPLHGSVLPKELHCRAHTQILSLGKNLHGEFIQCSNFEGNKLYLICF